MKSDLHPIPAAALDQPLCIVGTVGSGKTYSAKSAVEPLLREGRRVIIVDPTGVWHGLRTMADGSPGFAIVIFGGEQADVPVSPDAGAALGDVLATDRVTQAIVDVSEMTGGERTRFLTAMLERLYVGPRVPRHLVLDEADEMASQNPLPEQLRLLGIVDKIVRRGRVRGFRPMMITQRPAVLHKNVLSQIATLVAMRLTSPQDRKAVEGWVKGSADLDEAKAVLASLPKLAVGEGWVWAPREGVLQRTRFPAIATLDTSATPETGVGPDRPRAMAKVDVGALREAMSQSPALDDEAKRDTLRSATTIVGAKLNTPAAERPASAAELAAAERQGFSKGVVAGVRVGWANARGDLLRLAGSFPVVPSVDYLDAMAEAAAVDGGALPAPPREKSSPAPLPRQKSSPRAEKASSPPVSDKNAIEASSTLTGPQRELLRALAWWRAMGHDAPTRTQVAAIAGWKPKGSNLRSRLSELSAAGLVAYPRTGVVSLTDAGRSAAPEPDLQLTLVDSILGVLTGPQAAVFAELRAAGQPVTRADLATAIGWEPGGSNLRSRLSELSALELVDYTGRGVVALQAWVRG